MSLPPVQPNELEREIRRFGLVNHSPWPDGYKWTVSIPLDELMELIEKDRREWLQSIVPEKIKDVPKPRPITGLESYAPGVYHAWGWNDYRDQLLKNAE